MPVSTIARAHREGLHSEHGFGIKALSGTLTDPLCTHIDMGGMEKQGAQTWLSYLLSSIAERQRLLLIDSPLTELRHDQY
jgi:hypothetical protein